jgi:hypothetical protein
MRIFIILVVFKANSEFMPPSGFWDLILEEVSLDVVIVAEIVYLWDEFLDICMECLNWSESIAVRIAVNENLAQPSMIK